MDASCEKLDDNKNTIVLILLRLIENAIGILRKKD